MKSKEIFFLKYILLILLFAITSKVAFAAGYITKYDIELKINIDGSLNVTEIILYNFKGDEMHGIFRDIPLDYETDNNEYRVTVHDLTITDENSTPYEVSITDDYAKHLKIGSKDILLTGLNTYIIKYKVDDSINFLKNFDEFYWNATSNHWKSLILDLTITTILPKGADGSNSKYTCYAGYYGKQVPCAQEKTFTDENTGLVHKVYKKSNLQAGEGVSIVMGFSKKVIEHSYSLTELFNNFNIVKKIFYLFPIIAIIFIAAKKKKRKIKRSKNKKKEFEISHLLRTIKTIKHKEIHENTKRYVSKVLSRCKGVKNSKITQCKSLYSKTKPQISNLIKKQKGVLQKLKKKIRR